jgi:hypothetical protein
VDERLQQTVRENAECLSPISSEKSCYRRMSHLKGAYSLHAG